MHALLQVLHGGRGTLLRATLDGSGDGVVLGTESLVSGGDSVQLMPLSLEGVSPGTYSILFDVLDPDGRILTSKSAALEVVDVAALARPALVYRHSFETRTPGWLELTLARQYVAASQHIAAEVMLRRGMDRDGGRLPQLRWELAEVLLFTERPDAALEILRPLEQKYPNQVDVVEGMGVALYLKRDFREALPYLEKAAELRIPDPSLLNAMAMCYQSLLRMDEAVETLERSLALDPAQPTIRAHLEEQKGSLPPDRPEQRFRVFVMSSPRGERRAVRQVNRAADEFMDELKRRGRMVRSGR